MAQRRRRTTKRTVKRTARRTTTKTKRRAKKGVSKAAQAMKVSPAQKKRLNNAMRDFQKQINVLTRKYNQILNHLKKW